MPRQAGQHIPKAQREDLRTKAWQMSKDGYSVVYIAKRMDLNRITVQALINEQYAENSELRKASGLANQDLMEYLAVMDDDRARAVEIHNRTINRLQDEEELEALHAQIRDEDGKPPTTAITRALQFYMSGLPTALHAIDTMMMAMERERIPGNPSTSGRGRQPLPFSSATWCSTVPIRGASSSEFSDMSFSGSGSSGRSSRDTPLVGSRSASSPCARALSAPGAVSSPALTTRSTFFLLSRWTCKGVVRGMVL
jgi:hypothetical protein